MGLFKSVGAHESSPFDTDKCTFLYSGRIYGPITDYDKIGTKRKEISVVWPLISATIMMLFGAHELSPLDADKGAFPFSL